jgi:predicted enzyme related to lactoylglutathione lyase
MHAKRNVEAVGRWSSVQVDCADPVAEATFWAEVLGSTVDETIGDPPHYVVVSPTASGGPWLSFQRVPEPKTGKNRLHLDVVVEYLDVSCGRIEDLGGRRASGPDMEEYGFRWRLMADPEGNEFCLIVG